MEANSPRDTAPEIEWNDLAPGSEVVATVLMASGFALPKGQRVRERYRVERVLGEGTMGQVLAVTLSGTEDRQVYALKVVARRVDVDDDGRVDPLDLDEAERQAGFFADLLRQEASKQEFAQRNGVPVARLFALVQLDDGSIGLRMELARGQSLEERLEAESARRHEPPDVIAAVALVRKLMSQLRRLHEMVQPGSAFGFIHSDIKPGNIFVEDSDPSDVLLTLLDFGVATAGHAMLHDLVLRQASRKTLVLHQTGGTLGYAPPYHFSGKPTPLSDTYAALVILYELITTELPWSFGDLEIAHDNLSAIEMVMLSGPRLVRAVRPSIRPEDAAVLDEFFGREFQALHTLARKTADALSASDEASSRSALEQLSRLARDYQARLDELRAQLQPSFRLQRRPLTAPHAVVFVTPRDGRPEADPGAAPAAPEEAAAPAEPPVEPPAEPGAAPAVATTPPVASIPPPASPSGAPTVAAGHDAPAAASSGTTVATGRAPFAGWRRRGILLAAAVAVPLVVSVSYRLGRTGARAERGAATQERTPARLTPDVVREPVHAGAATDAAVAAPEPPPPPPRAAARTPAGPRRCRCEATVRGTLVVASGGALAQSIVLCAASQPVDRRTGYVGTGEIPPEVFGALPRIACRGRADAYEMGYEQVDTPEGPLSVFTCRHITRGGRASATDAAGAGERRGGHAGGDAGGGGGSGGRSRSSGGGMELTLPAEQLRELTF